MVKVIERASITWWFFRNHCDNEYNSKDRGETRVMMVDMPEDKKKGILGYAFNAQDILVFCTKTKKVSKLSEFASEHGADVTVYAMRDASFVEETAFMRCK